MGAVLEDVPYQFGRDGDNLFDYVRSNRYSVLGVVSDPRLL